MALVCKYQLLGAEVGPDECLELNMVLLISLQGWPRDLCMGLSYSFDQVGIQCTVFIEYPALLSMHMIIFIEVSVEDFPELSLQLLESRVRPAIDTVAEELQNSQ